MQVKLTTSILISYILGILVFIIGLSNLILVHPVPGIVFLVLSFLFFPPADALFIKWFGRAIPIAVKIILALVIIWFTLGVSDLGDMIDGKLMH